jgi:hypothetical protein
VKTSEIIRILEQGLEWEEEFILNYDREPVWELLRTVGKSKFSRIKPLLEENISDTRKHSAAIKGLIGRIRGGENGAR